MIKKIVGFVIFAALVSSCIPNERVIYLQNKEDVPELGLDTLIQLNRQEYVLQPNDRITLSFYSEQEQSVEKYNRTGSVAALAANRSNNNQAQGGSAEGTIAVFDLDKEGFIEINTLGRVVASGFTLRELKFELEKKIREEAGVKDILVRAGLAGIPYTIYGEIRGGGSSTIFKNEANIIEAISNAGGLNINADRAHVQIFRQYPDGARVHEVDVTDRNLMTSKFYYIQPNDMIYIKPLKIRELGAGSAGLQNFSLIIGTVSSAFIIINLLGNN